jgi:predicted transcriptional regulator
MHSVKRGFKMKGRIMLIDPHEDLNVIKGLASEIRIRILDELRRGEKNIKE